MTPTNSHSNDIEILCLASSSEGNAYVLRFPPLSGMNNKRTLMIECGLPIGDLEKRLFSQGVLLKEVYACIITHEHKDHSEALTDLATRGIKVFANKSTIDGNLTLSQVNIISGDRFFEPIVGVSVYAFNVQHDVPSLGYLINDMISRKTILFINDTHTFDLGDLCDIQYDYVFIECNHVRNQLEMVIKQAKESDDLKEKARLFKYERQRDFHLSLAGTKKMLNSLNREKLQGVFLMHLSTDMANEYVMKKEIEKTFNVKTYVCSKSGGIK